MPHFGDRPQVQQRCAIYTRKSSVAGLDLAINSLETQREVCEAKWFKSTRILPALK